MTEQRYSLDEARRILAREVCALHGHSWDIIETDAGPEAILCSNCGVSYKIVLVYTPQNEGSADSAGQETPDGAES